MLVAHAAWHGGALCLWAERTGPHEPSGGDEHPFATRDFGGTSYEPLLRGAFRVELTMLLPTAGDHPLPSAELGPEPVSEEPGLRPWRVPALVLEPFPAMALLQAAEHSGDVVPGSDLRFLCVLADEAVHLARRGQVLPALLREDGDLVARWRPVLDDPARFRALARAMPAACRAADGGRPAAEVLREALSGLVDTAVRGTVPHPLLPARRGRVPDRLPLAERWAEALTGPSAEVAREPGDDPDELIAELDAWAAAARRPSGPLRVCFRLAEPGAEEFNADPFPEQDDEEETEPGDAWRVEFALQGTDDPSLYVPAAMVWAGDATSIPDAEETLLAGLGRALRLFPDIAPALDDPAPAALTLDTAGAFRFLRRAAPMLAAAGFGVLLPQWAGKAKLGMKLTTRTDDPEASAGAAAPSGFDLKGMVNFRWDLAIGDESIDEAELEELARLKTPLVRLRGQWVELDEEQLEAALDFLRHPRRGRMAAAEAIRAIVHAGDDALPLTAVDADGTFGDLLSGEADRRLTPMRTPRGFNGTLRPFQERGLAWLKFLDGLGLGAILADSMGLGKCVGKDEFVHVNGALIKAKDVWARYATGIEPDGEGQWSVPSKRLTVNSIAEDGRIVTAPITRLYRQHIREKVRKVTLDDGSRIVVTRRHRLMGVDGWTRDIRPRMRLCVPARLRHDGDPVDPDLTVLLAWQIAEGSEDPYSSVVITQKDVRVLHDLHGRLLKVAERFALRLNDPAIMPSVNAKAAYLRFSGMPYRRLLEEHAYQWGRNSAHKRIPDGIVSADDATVRLFLRHYFAAEASVNPQARVVEISSASVWIIRQLSAMLRRFGIWLRVTTKWKHATNGRGVKRPYQVALIGGHSLRLFHEHIGIADPAKQARLDAICRLPHNTNVEGVPGSDLLQRARELTALPMRHFGVRTVYFYGGQELSRATARAAVEGMDRMLSGEMRAEHANRIGNKWTARTAAAYENLDRAGLREIRDLLDDRASREVFYAKVVSVEEVDYDGYVYDFEVAGHHNYVAEGMLCHNTAQTLALLASEREDARPGPTLLIGPMSLVGNWQREAARFAPKLRVYVHHGTGRHRGEDLLKAAAAADLVLTTYGTAARDAEMLAPVGWERVVCDEAQALKNSGTRQARAVRSIPARTRIALTGTPVENHLTELWSIMEFANPGLLGPRAVFRQRFAVPIEREGDEQAAIALKRATQPFILRRLKTDRSIISDLPEKQEIKVYCNLTTEQASLYQATVDDMLEQIAEADDKQRRGLVLATMAKLKQVCNHPAHLLKDGSRLPGRSGKLERLEEICAEVLDQGEKALVFTQYAEFGSMLQPYLAARLERPVLWLHGGTSKQARDDLVQHFQHDEEPAIFLLSLKAAGTGLTLTAANHVVHVDRWWNPAVEDQATDRAFRIGQTRNVQVRKFICVGTMEERVDEMIERKKALAESIVGTGEEWLTELSVAELRDVLRLSPEAVSD